MRTVQRLSSEDDVLPGCCASAAPFGIIKLENRWALHKAQPLSVYYMYVLCIKYINISTPFWVSLSGGRHTNYYYCFMLIKSFWNKIKWISSEPALEYATMGRHLLMKLIEGISWVYSRIPAMNGAVLVCTIEGSLISICIKTEDVRTASSATGMRCQFAENLRRALSIKSIYSNDGYSWPATPGPSSEKRAAKKLYSRQKMPSKCGRMKAHMQFATIMPSTEPCLLLSLFMQAPYHICLFLGWHCRRCDSR